MKSHPLKAEREIRGWSQARVAEALGTTTRTVSRWEQGQTIPYPYYREQLCTLFGKNARQLGLLTEDESVPETIDPPSAQLAIPLPPAPVDAEPEDFIADPAIPAVSGHASDLLGRDVLLQQIRQHLVAGSLTALQGMPGIGKTALAVALATDHTLHTQFCDGVLWVGLGPQPNVLSHLAHWGTLLGLTPADVENAASKEAWGRAIHAAIGQRRFLLIIDDAWNVEDAFALQLGGSQCAHLLTTRLPQVAFAFAKKDAIPVPELTETDGLALLARSVPQLVQQDNEDAQALVRAVGGLPLALTLMGKYLATQAFTRQPRRLQTALTQLQDAEQRLRLSVPMALHDRSPMLPANIPLSLHAAIMVSVQRLDPAAHTTLCALAVFPAKPSSFSEETALAISLEPAEALDTLWDAGLMESMGPERYTIHQSIVDYAHIQGEQSQARQRLASYMIQYIQQHEQDYELLQQEHENIMAALETAGALDMKEALIQGTMAIISFMRVRGHYTSVDHFLQIALQAATALGDASGRMTALRHLGTIAQLRGDYLQAEAYSQEGLTLARSLGQIDAISALLTTRGLVAFYRGDYSQARVFYTAGLQVALRLGDRELICQLLSNLGSVTYHLGNYTQAIELYQEGLDLARQDGYRELISRLLSYLGGITLHQGQPSQAERYCQEGLALARQLGHRELMSSLLTNSGAIALHRGNYTQAEDYYQEGLAFARQIAHRAEICTYLTNLGALALEQGDYTQAENYLQEGIALARELVYRGNLAILLTHLGSVAGQQGHTEQANTDFQESLELARQLESPWHISSALRGWGELHLQAQRLDAATAAFREILDLDNTAERNLQLVAQADYGLARIAALRQDFATARRLGQTSLDMFQAMEHHRAQEVQDWLQALSQQSQHINP